MPRGNSMRGLLFACIAIVLVAVSAPGMISHYVDRAGSRSPSSAELPLVVDTEDASGSENTSDILASAPDQVEIEAESDGHFYVDAEVNFGRVRLVVDTGATVTALRQSDAEAAGLRFIGADFTFPVATANGTAYAAETELDSVAVEGIEVEEVRALVLPDEQLAISLLGGSFLNRLSRFEVSNGTLIFEN
jgi:aspartyl protease family protein